jgi:uncharacterized protein (DUF1778 family)
MYNVGMATRQASRRINMRLNGEQEDLLRQAAAEQGESLTGFVLAAATARAREVIEQAQRIELSKDDFTRFVGALNGPDEDLPVLRRYVDSS